MAGASLLVLLDDIAAVLDDIALLTKVAAKKTSGVLGDDLALNAQQVAGVRAERELPVVWAVAKGSAKNKLILVPAAIAISAIAPWAIIPLLMAGGLYLCFEGFEKIAHSLFHRRDDNGAAHAEKMNALINPDVDLVSYEKEKIRGAIRTDFILSAEIIVIALGTVKDVTLTQQVLVVSAVAALVTVGVYGLVAAIVKIDDAGLCLLKAQGTNGVTKAKHVLGRSLLRFAPFLMKTLSIVGTAAMFVVGGGILVHGLPHVHEMIEQAAVVGPDVPGIGDILGGLISTALNGFAGVVAGGIALAVFSMAKAGYGKHKT